MIRIAVLCLGLAHVLPSCRAPGCENPGRTRYEPRSFLGYACEGDCQRHKHGFRWAERWAVTDSRSCAPLGRLEAQGCLAYLDRVLDAEAAGERWAVENEIADPCLCNGAGEGFRAGCTQAATLPAVRTP
jgi:hypothetical protein